MGSSPGGGWRQRVLLAGAIGGVALLVLWPFPVARAAGSGSGAGAASTTTTTTTTSAPPAPASVPLNITNGQSAQQLLAKALASVPLNVSNGQPAQKLLANALTLTSMGVDHSAMQAAVAATQVGLDRDAVTVRKMNLLAAQAQQQAAAASAQASQALAGYHSLDSAVKEAVLFLYTSGPAALSVNPAAGDLLAYAADYADTALTPNGLLSTRRQDARAEQRSLAAANRAEHAAERAQSAAAVALAAEQAEQTRLLAELKSVVGPATAARIFADRINLASQAGTELLSASALQFTPKNGIPAPLPTTAIALAWAFAELGKPYVWGATGPNSFDCSGLTQFVWAHAGVAIPRVAADQYAWTIPVPLSQLLPGDLVFYGRTDIHHVGIYIGDGLMINAPHTGDVVRVSSIWWSDLAGFARVHAPGVPVPPHSPPTAQSPGAPVVVATPGPVPSQAKPPAAAKAKPSPAPAKAAASTTTTTRPSTSTSTSSTTSTTVAPTTTTAPATTTTTIPVWLTPR